jgi:hypothetical protein
MADTGAGAVPDRAKLVVFFGVFGLLYLYYLVVIISSMTGQSWLGARVLGMTATLGPGVMSNVSVPGEAAPLLLGATLAWAAPGKTSIMRLLFLLVVTGIGYLMYLHLGSQLSPAQRSPLQEALVADYTDEMTLPNTLTTLSSYAGSLRGFAATVFGGVIGFRFNPSAGIVTAPIAN